MLIFRQIAQVIKNKEGNNLGRHATSLVVAFVI